MTGDRADVVVETAGWRTRDLVAPFFELLRPVRYQTVNLAADGTFGDSNPFGWEALAATRPPYG